MKKVLFLSLLATATFVNNADAKKNVIDINNFSENREVILETGKTYFIHVKANNTTGYHWEAKPETNCNVSIVNESYKADKNKKKMVGVGGTKIYEIKATQTGFCTIEFEYQAPGSNDVGNRKVIQFKVWK